MRVRKHATAFAALSLTFLQGCSIGHYNVDPQVGRSSDSIDGECELRFHLDLSSNLHTNTTGDDETDSDRLMELTDNYVSATNEALESIGCSTRHVLSIDSSNLQIEVSRQNSASALPQEWLTGLSFGLIPSWGTREAEYVYEFDRDNQPKPKLYSVSKTTYNHLVFFPVFWTMFFTLNEYKVYKKALANYVERT